jgi:transcriptional regulator with XRE-family HTH domain
MLPQPVQEMLPRLWKHLRQQKGWSRERLARRLGLSAAVIYNIENGKSRIKLGEFFKLARELEIDAAQALTASLFSVQSREVWERALSQSGKELSSWLCKEFRRRLKFTQAELAAKLGYSSSSMIHHFEKGIREASLVDLLAMMILAGDNVRGFIHRISASEELASCFPEGSATKLQSWEEYWSHPYISAMRQIIRTDRFAAMTRLPPGYFCDILGITTQQEALGLSVLTKLKLIEWRAGKPVIDPSASLFTPHNIAPEIIKNLKAHWANFIVQKNGQGKAEDSLLSIDLVPFNRHLFRKVVEMTRSLQDEIHGFAQQDTDGFVCLAWMGAYVEV